MDEERERERERKGRGIWRAKGEEDGGNERTISMSFSGQKMIN